MHEDTIRLLEDCTAGIARTVSAIDGLLPEIRDHRLRQTLQTGREAHLQLHQRSCELLQQVGGQVKTPSALSLGLSRLRNSTRMGLGGDDTTAAYLVARDCETGAKALCRSRNRYAGADAGALSLTQALITCEDRLSNGLRSYL